MVTPVLRTPGRLALRRVFGGLLFGGRSVVRSVMLGRFLGMMGGVDVMTMRKMGMVTGFLVVTRFVMIGRGPVMLGRFFVMLCCLDVVFSALFRHRNPFSRPCRRSSAGACDSAYAAIMNSALRENELVVARFRNVLFLPDDLRRRG